MVNTLQGNTQKRGFNDTMCVFFREYPCKPYFLLSSCIWVVGCVFGDSAAHFEVLINHDPFLCRLKDRWLVYILHCDGDGSSGDGQRNSKGNLVLDHHQQRETVGQLEVQTLKIYWQLYFSFSEENVSAHEKNSLYWTKSLGSARFVTFFKEVFYAHHSCIFMSRNT